MLKYIGEDTSNRYIVGVPARDLDDSELDTLPLAREELLASGMYAEEEGATALPSASNSDDDGEDN